MATMQRIQRTGVEEDVKFPVVCAHFPFCYRIILSCLNYDRIRTVDRSHYLHILFLRFWQKLSHFLSHITPVTVSCGLL